MDWLRRKLHIKTDDEIIAEVKAEPTIRNAQRALGRASRWTGITDDILEDLQTLEAKRRAR